MSRPLLLLALAALLVAGLGPLLVMSARLAADPEATAGLLDGRTLDLLGRTLTLGLGAAAIALLVGVPFGLLTARTNVPGARLWGVLGLVPLILPPLILAVAWTPVASEMVRMGSELSPRLQGLAWLTRGAPMTVFVMGLGTFPIVALFVGKAARRIDARREEAAELVGGLGTVLRMQLPLVMPAAACAACFAFVFAINDFAVPDYVSSVGRKFNVYADEVFASWQVDRKDAQAVATALPLVALTLLALLPALAMRRRGALATVDSDFVAPAPLRLGRWRLPALLFCLAVVAVGVAVPLGRLLFEAGGGRIAWQVDKLQAAFGKAIRQCRESLLASLGYSLAVASAVTPVAFVLGYAIARARWGRLLEVACVLPIAVPAMLFGIGNIVLWNNDWTYGFYASGGLVVLMLAGRFLAFPTLIGAGAVASLDPRLEEAAALARVRPAQRLARVVAPNLMPSLAGGWVMVFVLAMRELDAAILVPAANRTAMFRLFNAVHFGRDDFVAALALLIVFVTVVPGLLWTLLAGRRLEVLP